MKNRSLPFGYQYENGCIIIHPTEAPILLQLLRDYLDGQSLLNIAKRLNTEQVEYMPGVIGWNKARIMRIIEDKRYIGGNGYPSLIDEEAHAELQSKKAEKNKLKDVDRQADIFKLSVPVLCPKCGTEMSRRHDSRNRCSDTWTCRNSDCHTIVPIADDSLLNQITELLNRVIESPELIQEVTNQPYEPTLEIRKIENEIGRGMEMATIDVESLKAKMLESVSLKYMTLPTERNTANRLRVDFESWIPLAVFSADLTNRTVNTIRLAEDGTVELILRNGQTIRKE